MDRSQIRKSPPGCSREDNTPKWCVQITKGNREVIDLKSRLKGQEEFQEYKAKTTDYVMKLSTENQHLKETKEAYDNLRSAIGREECERLERLGQYQRMGVKAADNERMMGLKQIR